MSTWQVFLVGTTLAAVTVGGGFWLTWLESLEINRSRLETWMALGTGYLVAMVWLDLVPESLERLDGNVQLLAGWVLAGIAIAHAADHGLSPWLSTLLPRSETAAGDGCDADAFHATGCSGHGHGHGHEHDHSHGYGHAHGHEHGQGAHVGPAIACLAVCSLFDGVTLASALQAGQHLGGKVTLGLLLHLVPEGLLASCLVLGRGGSESVARRAAILVGAALLVGVSVSVLLRPLAGSLLPLSTGILLQVALSELLPGTSRTRAATLALVLGAVAVWLETWLIPHAGG